MSDNEDVTIRRGKYMCVEFTTESGKKVRYCMLVPSELEKPWVPSRPGPPPDQPVIIDDGIEEDPRPVPWIVDLGLIASALGYVDTLRDDSARESARAGLKKAAEAISAAAEVNLLFPE